MQKNDNKLNNNAVCLTTYGLQFVVPVTLLVLAEKIIWSVSEP